MRAALRTVMRSMVVVVLVLGGLATRARAEEPAPPPPVAGPSSPGVAIALSLGATTAAWGALRVSYELDDGAALGWTALGATLLAPSVGHWYTGDYLTVGLGIRAASAVMVVEGLREGAFVSCHGDDERCGGKLEMAMVGAGAVGYVVGTMWDLATAPKAARDANRERARSLTIAPQLAPGHTGVAVMGTF